MTGWIRRLGHSLQARLVLVFLALALGTILLFVSATRELFSTGWRELARPLVADYLDHLAADIGSPPDLARARALVQRLPLSIRIDGPQLHWDSHAATHPPRPGRGPHDPDWRDALERRTADGHRIRFGVDWAGAGWHDRPRWFGWATLAALLAMTASAHAWVRQLLRPLADILNALATDLVASQFAGRGIALDLAPGLPPLQADRARLQLLLRNLLDNALRHGGGSPVQLHTVAVDGGWQLTVRDHGPGVDPAVLARLGEPFFRPDAGRSRAAGGVGLGLYLCRLVAQSHGGSLQWRHAAPGLEVSLWLPGGAPA